MAKYSKKSQKKVGRAMHEMKSGKLKSGRSGRKVSNARQAIAIGLSEARAEGARVPKKAAKKGAKKAGRPAKKRTGAAKKAGRPAKKRATAKKAGRPAKKRTGAAKKSSGAKRSVNRGRKRRS